MKAVFSDDEKVKILADLIKINSVNGNELTVANYITALFKKYDIATDIIPIEENRVNLVAEIGQGKPVLGVSGHMDVVDPGEMSKWDTDPFELVEKDGKLFGRGSTDMKSGLAAFIISMIEIKENNALTKGTIRLMATVGEEVGEKGSQKFSEEDVMKDVDALIIGEPSGYRLVYAHKGSMDIRLTSKGEAAHSSMPSLGYNAIDPLINILNKANEQFRSTDKKSKLLGDLTFNTTVFDGGNQVNSIPENATAEINVRTIPEFDNKMVEKTLKQLVDQENKNGSKVDMNVFMSLESVEHSDNSKVLNLAKEIGEKYSNGEIPKLVSPGVTDASNLLKKKDYDFPFVVFGPGETVVAHQANEFVEKKMYLDFIKIYEELMIKYMQ